ncbi:MULTISPECIES: DUF1707 SHOCT-like domain-containing protein [Streptomyces]|uniref:DUF1707 SHOCT-like domain-containing protein n=1 Tax=Streptomyces TaxID=1883 RepID=UPI0027DBD55F|nr:DUF1707 domain-containing protein [Streptomyces triculaminicus]
MDHSSLRASDADRDRTAGILRDALAEGRLTAEEHAERIDAVYEARTLGQLEPLVRDLPGGHGPAAETAAATASTRPYGASVRPAPMASENAVAVFGGATRRGRWRPAPRTNVLALFGGVEIDLTEAFFEQREIVLNVWAVFGGVEIRVPENVSLRGAGSGVFGAFDVQTVEAPDPDAPVVVVTGFAVFGAAEAKPRKGRRLKNLRAAN